MKKRLCRDDCMRKRKLLFFCCILLICSCICHVSVQAQDNKSNSLQNKEKEKGKDKEIEETELYARSAVLMDADSGRVLFEKDGNTMMPMASTTKIMTLILALENGNPEDFVKVSKYAASMPDVQLNIREGEEYRLEDLLFSLMLESHNDSAVAIAEHVGKDTDGFAEMMNRKAAQIGCKQTNFVTPNGLDRTNQKGIPHQTTAEDLSKIMRYCIMESPKKEDFLRITRQDTYSFSDKEGKRSFTCRNHNAFLHMMDGALTGKTGFTGAAGYCYTGALRDHDRTYIVTLLACGWPNNKSYKWSDTKKLMTYGLDNYERQLVNEELLDRNRLRDIKVMNGQTQRIGEESFVSVEWKSVDSSKTIPAILLKENEKLHIKYEIPDVLEAPVHAKQRVGKVTIQVQNQELMKYEVITITNVEKIDIIYCFIKVIEKYLL